MRGFEEGGELESSEFKLEEEVVSKRPRMNVDVISASSVTRLRLDSGCVAHSSNRLITESVSSASVSDIVRQS
jgi:hypothetical protein